MMIVIGIVTTMLVVNWTYLVLVNRHTLRLTDTLALSAVRELLDEGRLQDAGSYMQGDDILAAQQIITTPVTGLLDQNNQAAGPSLRPTLDDLTITAGRVDDASQPVGGVNPFLTSPGPGEPYNSLRVEVLRSPTGLNPVQLLIRGFGAPNAAKISASSIATLDSRVVGFRPQSGIPAPVAPIAISQSAWFVDRVNGGLDNFPNGRRELDVYLRTQSGDGFHNGALVCLREGMSLNLFDVVNQIQNGVQQSQIHPSGLLGPATPSDPLPLDAERNSPANMATIATTLNTVASSSKPARVFPIYSSFSDPLQIVGFIGARILEAEIDDTGDGPQLRVRLEPEFIVHNTVVTSRLDAAAASVPENLYVHKIRLTR